MSALIPWVGGRGPAWDPFDDIWDIAFGGAGAGGRLWDAGRRGGRDDTTTLAQTNVDWRETDNAHIFTAELPGVRKEEVKVEVEEGSILKISGERTKEEENKSDTWHRVERRSGSFMRRFPLPENAIMDDVKCKLENGVLEVVVPKRESTPSARDVRSIEVA